MSERRVHHMEAVAIRKSGIAGWEPFNFKRVGDDSVITGGIPRVITRGPRKGKKTWGDDAEQHSSVVVTDAEIEAEAQRYSVETGNCSRCFGEGKVFHSWNQADGKKYITCNRCAGCGKVSIPESAHG